MKNTTAATTENIPLPLFSSVSTTIPCSIIPYSTYCLPAHTLVILFIASCILLKCELQRQEFLSVMFTAVGLTPRTEPSTRLAVKKFKEGMNPDPKGTHNRRERGLQNIYLQKSNWPQDCSGPSQSRTSMIRPLKRTVLNSLGSTPLKGS